ncbi:eukaryotic translation initiation factor 4E [Saitozyma podzolica]|uniref:Eukaryotic translation initiation factor 4E n=1 Tax=Saitozyma podzolica TaxID=1890683 RepID=A0A427YFV5_9TREE|nr:eukaryotic translation initiation factor 4E [Saitozyma podzolica]
MFEGDLRLCRSDAPVIKSDAPASFSISSRQLPTLSIVHEIEDEVSESDSDVSLDLPVTRSGSNRGEDGLKQPSTFFVESRHKLRTEWTFWFTPSKTPEPPTEPESHTPPVPAEKHRRTIHRGMFAKDSFALATVDSIEDFWRLYNNIPTVNTIPSEGECSFFRAGVEPTSVDPANDGGGKWSVQFPRDKSQGQIQRYWLNSLLDGIGEQIEPGGCHCFSADQPAGEPDSSCGLVSGFSVKIRPNFYVLSIWVNSRVRAEKMQAQTQEQVVAIGRHFKVHILGRPLLSSLCRGTTGYRSEVEFVPHGSGRSKKACRALKLVI